MLAFGGRLDKGEGYRSMAVHMLAQMGSSATKFCNRSTCRSDKLGIHVRVYVCVYVTKAF